MGPPCRVLAILGARHLLGLNCTKYCKNWKISAKLISRVSWQTRKKNLAIANKECARDAEETRFTHTLHNFFHQNLHIFVKLIDCSLQLNISLCQAINARGTRKYRLFTAHNLSHVSPSDIIQKQRKLKWLALKSILFQNLRPTTRTPQPMMIHI